MSPAEHSQSNVAMPWSHSPAGQRGTKRPPKSWAVWADEASVVHMDITTSRHGKMQMVQHHPTPMPASIAYKFYKIAYKIFPRVAEWRKA